MIRLTPEPLDVPEWITHCPRWLAEAERLTPVLLSEITSPVSLVEVVADPAGFQGWRVQDAPEPDPAELKDRPLRQGDAVTLDFGRHQVGYVTLSLRSDKWFNDAPVRLRLVFGEVPAEVVEPLDPYPGSLSRAWLQDVQVDVDVLPGSIRLPRRYAFRYLRIEVVDTSPQFAVRIGEITCETVTSAGPDLGPPPLDPDDRLLDQASLHTLRQCMQTVFEDGPKRDRRLWLGDLRLQALTNFASFRNFDLVKRCLLLHAGCARHDGVVPACVFDRPIPVMGNAMILDYTALFGPTLLDYVEASGDLALAEELWPVALHQTQYCLHFCDSGSHLFTDPGGIWLFFDWQPDLHKEASMQAVIIYSARRTAALARRLGRTGEADALESAAEVLSEAAREGLRDPATGLYLSGPDRQRSWCTQAWMVLAGVTQSSAEGSALFDALADVPEAVQPAGPYLWHHVVEALFACRREAEALTLLRTYWGGMLKRDATTFWEVYDPADERLSPYGSCLINSYCHAWSCTPAYFLRRVSSRAG